MGCSRCPDGHTPFQGGSHPWNVRVDLAVVRGDGAPTRLLVERSAGEHCAESDAAELYALINGGSRRPNRRLSKTGPEQVIIPIMSEEDPVTFRQVGWIGQSGDFYSLDEPVADHEPGSFRPLWVEVGD